MYELEPQVILTAVSIFFGLLFTAIAAMWMVWKTISESQAKTTESLAEMNKAISESQVKMHESLAEMNKTISELQTNSAKSFAEVRGDLKTVNTRMDGLDKRMDDMGGQVRDLKGEVRGINEFLRRDSVKNTEDDKES